MRITTALLSFFALLLLVAPPSRGADAPALWFYYPTNLLVDKNIDKLETIWKRAAAAGYSEVLLADSKFSRLDGMMPVYFKNCRRVKQIASDLKIQIVPAVFPIGYSNDLLAADPNLAEGLPVKDQLFIVNGGEARLAPDPAVKLNRMAFKDDNVTLDGNVATFHPGDVHARFCYKLTVPEYRCYHVSVKIRTKDFHGEPQIEALAGPWNLNWTNLGVKPTQDWKQHDIIFNSLDHKEVLLYFGVWSERSGELEWKDWKIEEVGLLNVLRRDGTPCTVKADGSGALYVEGKDYEPIHDPHMGNVPYAGGYQVWHEPPTIKTKLPDGTRLRVSWYHPVVIYDEQVAACISEPKTMQLLADQAKRMKELWDAPMYMMEHDEFRTCNWDDSCQTRKLTPGQMLADNVRKCTQLLRPQRAAVWSDMFDPYHNAVKGPYYLVNGPWTDSWEGLDKDVVIVNWNHGKRDESLKFFADRGNEQVLAGYYDGDLSHWKEWLTSAAKVKGIVGYMYTSWRNDYSKLEDFARMSRE